MVLHKTLLDGKIGDVSKSVLTEIFHSQEWQNQSKPHESDVTNHSKRQKITEDTMPNDCVVELQSLEEHNLSESSNDSTHTTALRFHRNLKQIVHLMLENKGKFPNDQERFMRILFSAISDCRRPTPEEIKIIAEALGMSERTTRKRMLRAIQDRRNMFSKKTMHSSLL